MLRWLRGSANVSPQDLVTKSDLIRTQSIQQPIRTQHSKDSTKVDQDLKVIPTPTSPPVTRNNRHRSSSAQLPPIQLPHNGPPRPPPRSQTLDIRNKGNLSGPRLPNPVSKNGGRSLTSTMHQVLSNSNHPKFRILVVGKIGSGKSSLINTVFKANIPAKGNKKPDIKREISPRDNRYLVIHEYSGFEPGNDQDLQAIQEFISSRTAPNCPPAERLDAVWICVSASDAIDRPESIGRVEEILNMRQLPVIIAFTKCDEVVAIEGGSSARTNARPHYKKACRSLFRKEPRDVSGVIVSVKVKFGDLIDDLVVTTDRSITGSRAARSGTQRENPRIAPVPLVWSAAVRLRQEFFIQASIEVGRSRYWRGLWSSPGFSDQPLKECVNVIHTDIIDIWNFNDPFKCLSNTVFKEKMSHIVKDLAPTAGSIRSVPRSNFAAWVYDVYGGSKENVRCVMEYIVNLTVILDDIFRRGEGYVWSTNDTQVAMDRLIRSGRRDMIQNDIHNFVKVTFAIRFNEQKRDLVVEKIVDLIWQYCVPYALSP